MSPASLRSLSLAAILTASLALSSCVASTPGHGIALNDPLGLVMDVARAGNPLRVYVLPAHAYVCSTTTGTITPDIPDLPPGNVPDAVVDSAATISGDMATAMAVVPTGDWTVLVRGRGTDPVSGRPMRIIASGCATVTGLGANATQAVNITLLPLHDMGMCGDGVLSPDEQCEPPNMRDCSATCKTTPLAISSAATPPPDRGPLVASTTGQRVAIGWTSANNKVGFRALDVDARPITSPPAFSSDSVLTGPSGFFPQPGPQVAGAPAVASDGRMAVAFTDLFTMLPDMGDVRVAFFSSVPAAQSVDPAQGTPMPGTQTAPSAAFAGNGALMVVFEDTMSATGISARVYAPGTTTPSRASFPIGTGRTGAAHPIVAGSMTDFVVVFASAADVFYQRFGADGAATDAMAVGVLTGADAADTQDQPAVAANADGSFLVAWNEHSVANGDGNGTTIRARPFTVGGMPAAAALVLPSSPATQAGDQTVPTVAAADGRYLVAWASAGGVFARVLSGMGAPLPNREQPQTAGDFMVAVTGSVPSACAMGLMPASWLVAYDDRTNVLTRRYPR